VRAALAVVVLVACGGTPIEGPPSIEVGTGQFDFEPVKEGQEVPIVRGPQGGDHVWLAVRIRNLDPRQLRIDSQLYEPESMETGDSGAVVAEPVGEPFFFYPPFFDDEEDGVWRTAGLPHQVERSEVRNQRLRLEVLATDREVRTATGDMIIVPVRVDE